MLIRQLQTLTLVAAFLTFRMREIPLAIQFIWLASVVCAVLLDVLARRPHCIQPPILISCPSRTDRFRTRKPWQKQSTKGIISQGASLIISIANITSTKFLQTVCRLKDWTMNKNNLCCLSRICRGASEQIRLLKQQGYQVVLVTSNLDFLMELAQQLGAGTHRPWTHS